ncbi:aspartate racemase [Acinetobacter sp. ANC 4558]|uniref:aspartate/glutamate racemase family protein n=1 Tax=Acinetobacter sp. ANC 4558 TaxID=1977876 RepID=UPI000A353FA5|nr:amino acid racemase [Acinetobacter sp. ANC 4558]OTG86813.1 aspartate racemase [Acinetobacter sp. ANC 4558]
MTDFSAQPTLGILGGMGPGAAVDFQQRLLDGSPATKDQEHIPTIVWNHGGIPDRQLALKNLGESPLNAMLHGLKILERSHVSKIVIPCNTAHFWHTALQKQTHIEILNMVEITVQQILKTYKSGDKVGILATQGALSTELYQRELSKYDIPFVMNSDDEIEQEFMPAVYQVKRNEVEIAGFVFQDLSQRLVEAGAGSIILACTEIPIGLHAIHSPILKVSFDTTQILANACIDWFYHK